MNPEETFRTYDEQYWKPEPPAPQAGPRGGCLFAGIALTLVLATLVAIVTYDIVHGAELTMSARPHKHAPVIESMQLGRFGTYSDEYYARRWRRMCDGPARYDAMREAADRGRPNPC
jgi:hypothetical protein